MWFIPEMQANVYDMKTIMNAVIDTVHSPLLNVTHTENKDSVKIIYIEKTIVKILTIYLYLY